MEQRRYRTVAYSRILNADTAGAVDIWQVARRAEAGFGRLPGGSRLHHT